MKVEVNYFKTWYLVINDVDTIKNELTEDDPTLHLRTKH